MSTIYRKMESHQERLDPIAICFWQFLLLNFYIIFFKINFYFIICFCFSHFYFTWSISLGRAKDVETCIHMIWPCFCSIPSEPLICDDSLLSEFYIGYDLRTIKHLHLSLRLDETQ